MLSQSRSRIGTTSAEMRLILAQNLRGLLSPRSLLYHSKHETSQRYQPSPAGECQKLEHGSTVHLEIIERCISPDS